jgi:curved DNA-binding protein
MANLYDELGVGKDASADEIKKAYRKLAQKLHPDKNPGDATAEARFKAVNRAHQVLSDPKQRATYDEFGDEGLREGFNPEAARAYARARASGRAPGGNGGMPFDIEELLRRQGGGGFGDAFGDLFSGRGRRGPRPGADVASEVTVDFMSAIEGASLELRVQEGGEPVKVRVPPGAGEGDKIRIKGQGQPGVGGGPPGDLIVTIRLRPHPFYKRDGLDLELELPIGVGEAHTGAKVRVPTPAGHVTLSVPKHAQSGQVMRLKGKGVARKQQQGDLYVRFLVQVPVVDDPKVDAAMAVLAAAETRDLREKLG